MQREYGRLCVPMVTRVMRSITYAICFLLLAICTACQSQGWGKFWKTTKVTPTSAPASDTLTMISVPANTAGFLMGSADIGGTVMPEHTAASITVSAMVKYEVQYGDWLM